MQDYTDITIGIRGTREDVERFEEILYADGHIPHFHNVHPFDNEATDGDFLIRQYDVAAFNSLQYCLAPDQSWAQRRPASTALNFDQLAERFPNAIIEMISTNGQEEFTEYVVIKDGTYAISEDEYHEYYLTGCDYHDVEDMLSPSAFTYYRSLEDEPEYLLYSDAYWLEPCHRPEEFTPAFQYI